MMFADERVFLTLTGLRSYIHGHNYVHHSPEVLIVACLDSPSRLKFSVAIFQAISKSGKQRSGYYMFKIFIYLLLHMWNCYERLLKLTPYNNLSNQVRKYVICIS